MRTHGSAASAISPPAASADTSGPAVSWTATTMAVPMPSASQVACTPSPTAAAPVTGAVEPGRTGRGAVGQEGQL